MTSNDPITAIVDQLAAHADQLTRLDTRQGVWGARTRPSALTWASMRLARTR